MARQAKHYMADEIGRLIEQLGRWPGWHGGHASQSSMGWIMDFVSRRRQDEMGPSIPTLGGEAADTQEALRRIPMLLAECLVAYYTVPGTTERKLSTLNRRRRGRERIATATFYRHVDQAHPQFWESYMAIRQVARTVSAANVASSTHAASAVSRRHRLVAQVIGLAKPESAPHGKAD